jgi:aminomethyltransferase
MSPTLSDAIALAYLDAEYARPETNVHVTVRDEPKKARTSTTPFLDR